MKCPYCEDGKTYVFAMEMSIGKGIIKVPVDCSICKGTGEIEDNK